MSRVRVAVPLLAAAGQFERQVSEGISPNGGPKAGFAPLNCNHFFVRGGQPPEG
jgi:hypothetical protein